MKSLLFFRKLEFLIFLVFLLPACALCGAATQDRGDADGLLNKCASTLDEMRGDYVIDIGSKLRLAYKESPLGDLYILLRSPHEKRCLEGGVIAATLKIPKIEAGDWVAVSFDCDDDEHLVNRGKVAIGVFEGGGRLPAKIGWTIDFSSLSFKEIHNLKCRSFS